MNKLCRQYHSDIKSFFPIMGKPERKYLSNLMKLVEDYCDEEDVTTLEELYKGFGPPDDVVITYLEHTDTELLMKRIRLTKWIKRGIVIFLLIVLIGVSILGIYTYKEHKTFQQERMNYDKTVIVEESGGKLI